MHNLFFPFLRKELPRFYWYAILTSYQITFLGGRYMEAKRRDTKGRVADSIYEAGYSMYFTRDLNAAKEYCRDRYAGYFNKRYGMMTSSKAYDLKKYGIGPAFRPDVAGWFNADPGNSRSSCALSVAISEFDCQGLEIDMPIIGWGQDLQWSSKGWKPNADEGTDDYDYRINSYRVLLTRGRDGFIIFVPSGLDNVADVFKKAGIKEL